MRKNLFWSDALHFAQVKRNLYYAMHVRLYHISVSILYQLVYHYTHVKFEDVVLRKCNRWMQIWTNRIGRIFAFYFDRCASLLDTTQLWISFKEWINFLKSNFHTYIHCFSFTTVTRIGLHQNGIVLAAFYSADPMNY